MPQDPTEDPEEAAVARSYLMLHRRGIPIAQIAFIAGRPEAEIQRLIEQAEAAIRKGRKR